jgi:release factor glutamine methyltransferase
MTIAQALQWAKQQLIAHQVSDDGLVDSATVDSKVILCASLDCELVYLHTWPEKLLTPAQLSILEEFIAKRITGVPVAHIIGYRDFWSLRLHVSAATLIPRPETERLVEIALELPLPTDAHVLDLGTGTGAIALSLASEQPKWQVMGLDKSPAAVALATHNAQVNQLHTVKFIQSDWFSAIDIVKNNSKYDLIVTNPPYVEEASQYLKMGDVRFEPASALTSGVDGLEDIRLIAEQAKSYLRNEGWLLIEHGFQQGQAVADILKVNGFINVRIEADINNLPRATLGQFL